MFNLIHKLNLHFIGGLINRISRWINNR